MNTLINIIKENIEHRGQMLELAKMHQRKQFRGSDMGLLWMFAKPCMYIVVFYVAITIGFRAAKEVPGLECPYFVWLTIGMISFFYMRDMILNGANCLKKYAPLVSKTNYPISTLPTSVSLSYLTIHFGMLVLGIIVCFIFQTWPSIYWIQTLFYMLLMLIMSVFWSIGTGIISIIYRDFYNFLQVINQMVFWLSAILFDVNSLNPTIKTVFLFNPITYIVEGYRNAFCRHIWFWEEPLKLGCFLIVLVIMAAVSVLLYKKLIKRLPDII
ncbi:MAG: ABC transporter permease [Clostridia bacterium]|nr:ABC transporter permease [Clostridia bacterium]